MSSCSTGVSLLLSVLSCSIGTSFSGLGLGLVMYAGV